MSRADDPTEQLLAEAARGDRGAFDKLAAWHRPRLRELVALRLDIRIHGRVDPSDVIQETLVEAARRFSEYTRKRPMPFYPWLRQIALDRLVRLHRRHIGVEGRSVTRQAPFDPLTASGSLDRLAERLPGRNSAPDQRLLRSEARREVRAALARLSADDREVLVLRYLEQLSGPEVAAILGISQPALRMRQLRALERLERAITQAYGNGN